MLSNLSIKLIQQGIKDKQFSYLDIINEQEQNFLKFNKLNVAIETNWEQAKKQASNLRYDENKPLNGISIAIKDMFLVKDTKTTAASKVLKDFVAPYDAFVVQKLKENNYLMPFKANLDEFAMGSTNETSYFGPSVNPWILEDRILKVPGGSSGGSAAAVASYTCHGALGTDTGGSVRQPASFCGVVGFKPSYGRCSRRGVISFASSLDHPGVFARNVEDACIIMENIAGHDKHDSTSIHEQMKNLSNLNSDVKGQVVGVPYKILSQLSDEYRVQIEKTIDHLKSQGAQIVEIDIPYLDLALDLYLIISRTEAYSNLSRYDGVRFGEKKGNSFEEILNNTRDSFGKEIKRRLLLGSFVMNSEYDKFLGKAANSRKALIQYMNTLFSKIDVIIMPTTSTPAFEFNCKRSPLEVYKDDIYTILANMYKGPSIQIPIGMINNKKDNIEQNQEFDFLKTHKDEK